MKKMRQVLLKGFRKQYQSSEIVDIRESVGYRTFSVTFVPLNTNVFAIEIDGFFFIQSVP